MCEYYSDCNGNGSAHVQGRMNQVYVIQHYHDNIIQVAVLAPLALLLVLEARYVHFVIAHFNYFVLWSSASLAPTQHIYMYT